MDFWTVGFWFFFFFGCMISVDCNFRLVRFTTSDCDTTMLSVSRAMLLPWIISQGFTYYFVRDALGLTRTKQYWWYISSFLSWELCPLNGYHISALSSLLLNIPDTPTPFTSGYSYPMSFLLVLSSQEQTLGCLKTGSPTPFGDRYMKYLEASQASLLDVD
jgi:hypothetical protein